MRKMPASEALIRRLHYVTTFEKTWQLGGFVGFVPNDLKVDLMFNRSRP